ncbi:MAG: ribosomal protein S18-alanine N-acetyltransferase [Gammaproteobacteria bacterium]|nr:ribosomal protein S18-alanine N-acetyltransferase [Gammaproteobacteria bacterium]
MNALLKPLEMVFRPMRSEDLDALIKIERASYPYPWTLINFRDCLDSGYSCWVGEVEGALAGYWILMMAVGEGHILNCCIAPAWQGRGFGRSLVEDLIDTAREHGTETLYLEVRPSNTRAVNLYQRIGFESIALRRNYYPADQGREDALVMRMIL